MVRMMGDVCAVSVDVASRRPTGGEQENANPRPQIVPGSGKARRVFSERFSGLGRGAREQVDTQCQPDREDDQQGGVG